MGYSLATNVSGLLMGQDESRLMSDKLVSSEEGFVAAHRESGRRGVFRGVTV